MLAKVRQKFLPKNFQISLFKQMQNLKKRTMTVKEYTEEFNKINLRAGYIEDTTKKVARYINGLRFHIQDELSLVSLTNVDEAYPYELKVEERIPRRKSNRGKYGARGRGG